MKKKQTSLLVHILNKNKKEIHNTFKSYIQKKNNSKTKAQTLAKFEIFI